MKAQAEISAAKLQKSIGRKLDVLVDDPMDAEGYVTARSSADAPEIDGNVYIEGPGAERLKPGDLIKVHITDADEYDLYGESAS
jgi:ribosomal protein S12 methylthiotransferase